MSLREIINFYEVDEWTGSGGQPTAEHFAHIADAGYQVVLNLATPHSEMAVPEEGNIVAGLGMTYVNHPVAWDDPTEEDVLIFFGLMDVFKTYKVFVHCAMNMRVSCFLYLYRKHHLNLPEHEARIPLSEIWEPYGVWADLVSEFK